MARRKLTWIGTAAISLLLATMGTGCGGSLLPTGSTDGLLETLATYGITEDMTLSQVLDQLTVGDVLSAAQLLTMSAPQGAVAGELTDEQQAQLQALHDQFVAGEITEQEFTDALRDLLGDGFYIHAREAGGFGPGGDMHGPPIELTAEQQAAADAIMQSERDDIETLRANAEDAIAALLTEEQLALFEGLPEFGPHGEPPPGRAGEVFGGHRFAHRGGPGDAVPGDAGGSPSGWLTEDLNLTDEQQAAVDDILSQLHDAVRARQDQARTDFLALLTEEQLAQLESHRSRR